MPPCKKSLLSRTVPKPAKREVPTRGVSKTTFIAAFLFFSALAQVSIGQASDPCPRFAPGSIVTQPADLFSAHGVLKVDFSYNTSPDENGNPKFCFATPDGTQSPTLHVRPGDHLILNVKNNLPAPSAGSMVMDVTGPNVCGASTMNESSVNVHYHGTNTSPTCGQDEVIRTIINPGETYTYDLSFPADEPPGLYWYHPHIHGLSEAAVQGGASGAIVVDGIESIQPAVAGLPQRILLVRDQLTPCGDNCPEDAPAWDMSLNYVPILYPQYKTAILQMTPGARELWRVGNVSADTILDLELQYDGRPQSIEIVALDGVPVGSQDGTRRGKSFSRKHILVPPAGRAEFIVTAPDKKVKNAVLITHQVETGPDGDADPDRPIATIETVANGSSLRSSTLAGKTKPVAPWRQRFEGLGNASVTARRKLFFSEDNPDGQFFITVEGQTPALFNPNDPPAIVTTQGSVEEWTIENRALENHEFHIHQIHFMLTARNGIPVPAKDRQFLDMIDIPYWTGSGPYPSVTVRMDFRGPDIGDFVYHCHILEHEDKGMMAIIRVLPASNAANGNSAKLDHAVNADPAPARDSHNGHHATSDSDSAATSQSLADHSMTSSMLMHHDSSSPGSTP